MAAPKSPKGDKQLVRLALSWGGRTPRGRVPSIPSHAHAHTRTRAHTRTHMHTRTHTHVRAHTHTRTYTTLYTSTHVHNACTHVCAHTHIRARTRTRTHTRACACTCSSEGQRPSHRPHCFLITLVTRLYGTNTLSFECLLSCETVLKFTTSSKHTLMRMLVHDC
jgi:hypothetical protein